MPKNAMDITGRRYGKLVALEATGEKSRDGSNIWLCACDCGMRTKVSVTSLNCGNTRSCGCGRSTDLTGRRFGKLTAVKRVSTAGSRERNCKWLCRCDCGREQEATTNQLLNRTLKSCGKCEAAELSPGQQLDAISWAANRAGMTYGKFTASLSPETQNSVFEEYRSWRLSAGNDIRAGGGNVWNRILLKQS